MSTKRDFQQLYTDVSLLAGKPETFLYLSNHFRRLHDEMKIGEDEYTHCVAIAENLKAMKQQKDTTAFVAIAMKLITRAIATGIMETVVKEA